MKNAFTALVRPTNVNHFTQLINRLAFGNTVSFTDVAFSCAMFFAPRGATFFATGVALTALVWVIIAFFPKNKATFDVYDLCFYQLIGWVAGLVLYNVGASPSWTWYLIVGLQFLKLIRVYAPLGSTTAKAGWAVFGPITYWHARQSTGQQPALATPASYGALGLACCAAVIAVALDKQLTETNRLFVALTCPVFFTILDGPRLLFSWLQFAKRLAPEATSSPAETKPVALAEPSLPGNGEAEPLPEALDQFAQAYQSAHPAMRATILKFALTIAKLYPEKKPPSAE
jgi:hypothetical protein